MKADTVKVGVIGAGAISRDHVASCNRYGDAEVIAIADIALHRAKAIAKEHNIPRVYSSAARLIADPDVDAVTVAVPNMYHAAFAVAALKAGKHVLVEKPFAMNTAQARQVIAAARAARKVFTLGMNWRFEASSQITRELIRRGDIGDVYHAKTYVLRRTGSPRFGTWFCRKDQSGGGALLDIGVHFLDACLYLVGNFEPAAVSGQTYTKFGNRGIGEGTWGLSDPGRKIFTVDDFGTALIKMKNGLSVTLDASWVLHMESELRYNVEVFGTEGGASACPPKLFRFGKRNGEYEVVNPQGVKLRYPHANRFHNWLDAILDRDELEVKPAQTLAVQQILDGIYLSSKTGREVRIKA